MQIETNQDLVGMKRIGQICAMALKYMLDSAEVGMSTKHLDELGRQFLQKEGAASAPITAYQFPGYTCISLNDEAAHGIPREDRIIQAGDLLNVDVSAILEGYWGDTGASIIVPPSRPEYVKLCNATRQALKLSIEMAVPGQKTNAIGKAVEKLAKRNGYRTLRELGGHGVGRHIHEKPSIPNYYNKRNKDVLQDGMVITLEPFLNTGKGRIRTDDDGWTLRTIDGSVSAQYEHTVIIDGDNPILVTEIEGGYV
jgi:methionyl aminopeptidase